MSWADLREELEGYSLDAKTLVLLDYLEEGGFKAPGLQYMVYLGTTFDGQMSTGWTSSREYAEDANARVGRVGPPPVRIRWGLDRHFFPKDAQSSV